VPAPEEEEEEEKEEEEEERLQIIFKNIMTDNAPMNLCSICLMHYLTKHRIYEVESRLESH